MRLSEDIVFGRPIFYNSNNTTEGEHTQEESSPNDVDNSDGPFVTEIV